ncbi:MAG TPA: hypothetical protein VMS12_08850 [Thermoanaerobaculia bacterium]|nr:hypothetical protein [Thermoanaerobaculia bacterium]
MPRVSTRISGSLARQMDRLVREGWYRDEEALVEAALEHFVEHRSFLGDSPELLAQVASDALENSKPETALKFAVRALTLLGTGPGVDLELYKTLVELRVQSLLVLGRDAEARSCLEEAREQLPNSPGITGWMRRMTNDE